MKANPGFMINDEINKALLLWQAGRGVKISHSTDKILCVNFVTSVYNIASTFHNPY